MYMKDKERRITLRLNEEQFSFIQKDCEMLGITPSAYLRMVINSTMQITKTATDKLDKLRQKLASDDIGGIYASNNDENHLDDIVQH